MDGKTFIRKSNIDEMFDNTEEYEYRAKPIEEAKYLTEISLHQFSLSIFGYGI